jgi:hypothetical protein
MPPEATIVSPVIYEASSDTRNDTTPAISLGTAILWNALNCLETVGVPLIFAKYHQPVSSDNNTKTVLKSLVTVFELGLGFTGTTFLITIVTHVLAPLSCTICFYYDE